MHWFYSMKNIRFFFGHCCCFLLFFSFFASSKMYSYASFSEIFLLFLLMDTRIRTHVHERRFNFYLRSIHVQWIVLNECKLWYFFRCSSVCFRPHLNLPNNKNVCSELLPRSFFNYFPFKLSHSFIHVIFHAAPSFFISYTISRDKTTITSHRFPFLRSRYFVVKCSYLSLIRIIFFVVLWFIFLVHFFPVINKKLLINCFFLSFLLPVCICSYSP